MSGSSEQITSPDQRKPISHKAARAGAIITAIICLLMMIGNHKGHVEDVFLIATAAILVLAVVADWLLRKNGFRR
ncbi:MAG TPA: DUF2631 domain-containing protein [Actinocatenispora sp.]